MMTSLHARAGLIDIVVVNLYPFRETVNSGASQADCVEKIDIGASPQPSHLMFSVSRRLSKHAMLGRWRAVASLRQGV